MQADRTMQWVCGLAIKGVPDLQFANDGGVTIDPGTAGNLWNLARSAAQLYGRKLQEHTE